MGIACLYADYKDKTSQTLAHILGSFLRQFLTTASEPIPKEVTHKLRNIQRRGGKVRINDYLTLLHIRLRQLGHAFICIDAVDELEPKVRQQLLSILKELGSKTRIFLTGRSYIESEVQKHFHIMEGYTVNICASQQDVQEFIRQQILDDTNEYAMDKVLEKEIIDTISQKSQGM